MTCPECQNKIVKHNQWNMDDGTPGSVTLYECRNLKCTVREIQIYKYSYYNEN